MSRQESRTPEIHNPHQDYLEVVSEPESRQWMQGFEIEAQVFIEADYVDTKEELAEEYAAYLPNTYFIVAERDGEVGGAVRAITFNPDTNFKTVNDLSQGRLDLSEQGRALLSEIPLDRAIEVGTLAVKKELRGTPGEEDRLAVTLYGAIYGMTQKFDAEYVIASFDEKFYERFKAIFDPGVEPLGQPKDYMGSNTVPALIHVDTLMQHAKEVWEPVYDMMLDAASKVKYD